MAKKSTRRVDSGKPADDEDEDDERDSERDDAEDSDDSEDDDTDASGDGDDEDAEGDEEEEDERDGTIAKLRSRLKANDRRASALEQELRNLKDSDKPADERLKADLAEAQERLATVDREISDLRLENAFLEVTDHAWHNRSTALTVARAEGYLEDVLDEDGTVDKGGLKRAIKKLATEQAYLVKSAVAKNASGDQPTGAKARERSEKTKDKKTADAKLRGRFPSMAARR